MKYRIFYQDHITGRDVDRFENFISKIDGECWIWTGALNKNNGYGIFGFNGSQVLAHRFAYTWYIGDITPDLQILHECDIPQCVNPDHLFEGTIQENMKDRDNKGRQGKLQNDECPSGHPYSGDNLHIGVKGERRCRQCARDYYHTRGYYVRKRKG